MGGLGVRNKEDKSSSRVRRSLLPRRPVPSEFLTIFRGRVCQGQQRAKSAEVGREPGLLQAQLRKD